MKNRADTDTYKSTLPMKVSLEGLEWNGSRKERASIMEFDGGLDRETANAELWFRNLDGMKGKNQ